VGLRPSFKELGQDGDQEEVASETVRRGAILDQSLGAGTETERGGMVSVTVTTRSWKESVRLPKPTTSEVSVRGTPLPSTSMARWFSKPKMKGTAPER
jgi:hypothetical protein